MSLDTFRRALLDGATIGSRFGSPFSGLVAAALAEAADTPAMAALVSPWIDADRGRLDADAVGLRLLAGLHDLVLSGDEPGLAAIYRRADAGTDARALAACVRDVLARRVDRLARFMRSPPQTNEVGRSLCLLGGFLTVAEETGLPLRCLELGASAGLNQLWDRYRYDLGEGRVWGDAASPVVVTTRWSGGAPPLAVVPAVAERAACDQAPIDVDDPEAARRLQAYVWPDQPERMARLSAAIGLARAAGVRVDRADAADWAARHARPQAGVATVLYHSVFWQYPPAETRARLEAIIAEAAAQATPAAPFAWLRMEPDSSYIYEVRLALWPPGEERRLARAHPHGAAVEWG
jgi:hypothetical protein